MKKVLALLSLMVIFLVGCGQSDQKVYKIGVISDETADNWQHVADRLAEKENIQLEIVKFDDYVQPNTALAEGDIDANVYQYIPFLYEYNQSHETELRPIAYTTLMPILIYGREGIDSLNQIPDGGKVALIEDPVNLGNSLKQLEAAGLIKVDPAAGATPTLEDITDNPKQLEFIPMATGAVARSLGDVDVVVHGASTLAEAGLNLDRALYTEDTKTTSNLFRLTYVVNKDQVEDPIHEKILAEYQKQETIDYGRSHGSKLFYPAWQDGGQALADYEEFAQSQQ
ncbi:hypothetical protein AWM75_04925 [Aerococcus urinaehominis]|uniref:Uncharacterized protein n=1 Tax=Aerococcus urinaehominis TaxID=128944 RepID=A0A0X8FL78_9LACT|nr:MetQ/NlpA family ABC transporter substrate-binding protein [Aerococcus urinaehominis]AMB99373.1 hypothetical protein AWM75_04925 [Aerococcus urinaehominis]SDM22839.1 D-methionine transport system substrate-binding protein [Aerococcus urinaehominis]